ncbi:MAG: polysaccharide deacetylase family protein [Fimbriimonas sp.]
MPRPAFVHWRKPRVLFCVAIAAACLFLGPRLLKRASGPSLFVTEKGLLRRGESSFKTVAITIDDGPHGQSCEQILDALAAQQVTATFFVVGSRVDKESSLVRRMIDEGHEVGNHTMTHPRLDTLSAREVRHELLACQSSIRRATGREVALFRPPGMRSNLQVLSTARSLGYTTIDWTLGAKDFIGSNGIGEQVEPEPALIARRVLTGASNGSIILLHDAPATAKAMPAILSGLKARGFQIITLTQMLASLPRPVFVTANPYSRVALAAKKKPTRSRPKRAWVQKRRAEPRKLQLVGEEQYLRTSPDEPLIEA